MDENFEVTSTYQNTWEQFDDDYADTLATRERTQEDSPESRELSDDLVAQAFPEIIIKKRRKMESDTDSDFDWTNDPFTKRVLSSPVMKSKNGNSKPEISTASHQRTDSFDDSSYGTLRIGFIEPSHAESRQLDFGDENSLKNETVFLPEQISSKKNSFFDSNTSFDSCTSSEGHDGHPETRRTRENSSSHPRKYLPKIEHLILHRLPGEKLGMILGVEGGKEIELVKTVVVRSVTAGGAAERATGGPKGIDVGDRILEINGLNLHTLTHSECITVFKEMPLQVMVTVKRAKLNRNVSQNESIDSDTADILGSAPKGFILHDVLIQKARTEPLGLSIVPSYGTTKKYYQIKRLLASGPSAKSGKLQVGDRLIAYNNASLRNLVQSECMSLLRQPCTAVNFRILRPNNRGRRLRISVTKSGVKEIPGYSSDLENTSDPTDTDTGESRTTSGSEDNDGSNSKNLGDHPEASHPFLITDPFGQHQFKLNYSQANSAEAIPYLYDSHQSFLKQDNQQFFPHGLVLSQNMENLLSEQSEKPSDVKMSSSDLDFLASLDTLKSDGENFVHASHSNSSQTSNDANLLLDFGDASLPPEKLQKGKQVTDQSDLEHPGVFADIPSIAPYSNTENQNGYTDIWETGFGETNFISESDNDVPVTNIDDLLEDSSLTTQVSSCKENGPVNTLLDFEVLQTNGTYAHSQICTTDSKLHSNDVEVPLLLTHSEQEVEQILSGRSSSAIDKPEDGSISPFSSHSGSTVIHRAGSAFEDTYDVGEHNGVLDKPAGKDLLHVTTVQVQSDMQNFPDSRNKFRGEHVTQVSVTTSKEQIDTDTQRIESNMEESDSKSEFKSDEKGVLTLYLDGSDNSRSEFLKPEPAIMEDVIVQSKDTHQSEAEPCLEEDGSIIPEQVSRIVEINLNGATDIPKLERYKGDKTVLPYLVNNMVAVCQTDDRTAMKNAMFISQMVEEEIIIPAEKGSVLNAEYSSRKRQDSNSSHSHPSASDLIVPVKVPRRSFEQDIATEDELTKADQGGTVSNLVDSLGQQMVTTEGNIAFDVSVQKEPEKNITEDNIIPITVSRGTKSTPSHSDQETSSSQHANEEIINPQHRQTESFVPISQEETIVPAAAPKRVQSLDIKSTELENHRRDSLPQLADNLLSDLIASEMRSLNVINTEDTQQEIIEECIVSQEKEESKPVNVTDQPIYQTSSVEQSSVAVQDNIVPQAQTEQQTVLTRQGESGQRDIHENIVPIKAPRRSTPLEDSASVTVENSEKAIPHFVDELVSHLDNFEKKILASSGNKDTDVINEEEIAPVSKQLTDMAPATESRNTESGSVIKFDGGKLARNVTNVEKSVPVANQSPNLDVDVQTSDRLILDTSNQSFDSAGTLEDSLNSSSNELNSFSNASLNLLPALSPLPDTPPVRKLPSIKAFTAKGFTPVKLNSLGSPIKTVSLDRRITTKLSPLNTSPLTGLNLQTSSQSQIKVAALQTRYQDGPFQIDLLKGILGLGMKVNRNSDGNYQVSEIHKKSSVDKNGNIRVDDYVLSINGTELTGLPDTKVQQILRLLPRGIAKVVFSVQPISEHTNGDADNLNGIKETFIHQKTAPVIQSVKHLQTRSKISEKSENLMLAEKSETLPSNGSFRPSVLPIKATTYSRVLPQMEAPFPEKDQSQIKQVSTEACLSKEKEPSQLIDKYELTVGDRVNDYRSETSEPSSLSGDSLLESAEIDVCTQKNDDGDSAISISPTNSTPADETPSLKIEDQTQNDENKERKEKENLKPPPVKPRTKSSSLVDRSKVSENSEAQKMKKVEEWQLAKPDATEEAVAVTAYPVMVRPNPTPAPRVPRSPTTYREPPPVLPRTRSRTESLESNSSSKPDIEPLDILDPVFKPSNVARQFGTVKSPMSRKMSGLIDKFQSVDSEPESPGSDAIISPHPPSGSINSASPSGEPRKPFSFPLKEELKADDELLQKSPPKVAPKPKRRSGEIVYQPVQGSSASEVSKFNPPTKNPENDDEVVLRKKINFLRREVHSEIPSFVLSAARAQSANKDSSSDNKLGYRPRSAETVFSTRSIVASSDSTRLKGLQIPSKSSQKSVDDDKPSSTLQINHSKLSPALRPRNGPAAFTRIQPKIHKVSPKLNLGPIKLFVDVTPEEKVELKTREDSFSKRLSSSSPEGCSPRTDSAEPGWTHKSEDIEQNKNDSFETKFSLIQTGLPESVSLNPDRDIQVTKEQKELKINKTSKKCHDTKGLQHACVVTVVNDTKYENVQQKENLNTESKADLEVSNYTSQSDQHTASEPPCQFDCNTDISVGVDFHTNLEATPVVEKFAETMSLDVIDLSVTTASDLVNDNIIKNERRENDVQQSEENILFSHPKILSQIQKDSNTEQKDENTSLLHVGAQVQTVACQATDIMELSVEKKNDSSENTILPTKSIKSEDNEADVQINFPLKIEMELDSVTMKSTPEVQAPVVTTQGVNDGIVPVKSYNSFSHQSLSEDLTSGSTSATTKNSEEVSVDNRSENTVSHHCFTEDLISDLAGVSVVTTNDVSVAEDSDAPPDLPKSLPPPLCWSSPPPIPLQFDNLITTTAALEENHSTSPVQNTLPLALKRHQSVKPPSLKASSTANELEVSVEFVPSEASSPNAPSENKQLVSKDTLEFKTKQVSTSTPSKDSRASIENLGESPVSAALSESLSHELVKDLNTPDQELKIPPPSFDETPSPKQEKGSHTSNEQIFTSQDPSSKHEVNKQIRQLEPKTSLVNSSNSALETSELSTSVQQVNSSTLSTTSKRKWTFLSNKSDQSLLSASPNTSVPLDHSECSLLPPEELASLLYKANETLDETDKKEENEIIVVLLHKDIGEKVGLSFKSNPLQDIRISDVDTRSTAGKDGRILVNDQLLSINGNSVEDRSPHEARVMLRTSREQVVLVLARSPCPISDENGAEILSNTEPSARRRLRSTSQERKKALSQAGHIQINSSSESLKSTTFETSRRSPRSSMSPEKTSLPSSPLATSFATSPVERDTSKIETIQVTMVKGVTGLGFCLEGGKGSPLGDRPVLIKRLFKGGAADKCRLLQEKDEILEVNGKSFDGLRHYEAWNFLKFLPDGDVKLLIRR